MSLLEKPVEAADGIEAAAKGDVDDFDIGHFGVDQHARSAGKTPPNDVIMKAAFFLEQQPQIAFADRKALRHHANAHTGVEKVSIDKPLYDDEPRGLRAAFFGLLLLIPRCAKRKRQQIADMGRNRIV